MDCVYFDWNIFVHFRDWKFKGVENLSKYRIIEELKNSGKIVTYYSDAHLLDLMPENVDPSYLHNDLKAISLLTDDICLVYSPNIAEFKSFCKPIDMYNNVCKDFSMNLSLESIQSRTCMKEIVEPYLSAITVPEASEAKDVDLDNYIEQLFQDHNNALNNPAYFRSRRLAQSKKYQTNPKHKTQLSGSDEEKLAVFFELWPTKLNSLPSYALNRSDICLAVFKLLDELLLWSDSKYKNMMIDALHASYASHRDTNILVTDDSNLRNKAVIAYKVLGIELPVLSFDDFVGIYR